MAVLVPPEVSVRSVCRHESQDKLPDPIHQARAVYAHLRVHGRLDPESIQVSDIPAYDVECIPYAIGL